MPTMLKDGFSTTILFSGDTDIALYEKEVQPPGVEVGGEIDITTMLNTTWRTKAAKKLLSLTEHTFLAGYDPAVYDEIVAMIGDNQLITITFPDSSKIVFWGYLSSFLPNRNVEGEMPTAECTIIPTNRNNSDVEVAPDYQVS